MEIGLCYLFSWIRAQLGVQKFADALDSIPLVLGENAGMNPIDIMTELREKQNKGAKWTGVDVRNTKVTDMFKQDVIPIFPFLKKRILSLEVTSEEIHDGKILKKLVDDASENNKTKRVLADGMYDSNNNFRYLREMHAIIATL
jgi:chaperonin GroEL (HSP60 family)